MTFLGVGFVRPSVQDRYSCAFFVPKPELMKCELKIAENKSATVLVAGKIDRERRLKFVTDPIAILEYKEQVKRHLVGLISRGYNSFLFCSWGCFDMVLVKCLEEIQAEYSQYKNRLCLMAVLRDREFDDDLPYPEDGRFIFIIYREEESIPLTEQEAVTELLDNTTVLVYDNADSDHLVAYTVRSASGMGIESIDLNKV